MTDSVSPANDQIDDIVARAAHVPAPADQGLALVEREGAFGDRYRVWRGRSGRRYLVTVMPLGEALRIENAVILVVAVEGDRRRVVWAGEAAAGLPGFYVGPGERVEAHVHLIAASPTKRQVAVEDLFCATQGYSSIVPTSAAASQASVGSVTPSFASSRAVFST